MMRSKAIGSLKGYGNHCPGIADEMQLPLSSFEKRGLRSTDNEGWDLWQQQIVHTLHTIESLGFAAAVVYPGHYPLIPQVKLGIEQYQAEYAEQGGKMLSYILRDQDYADDGTSGDHAAAFETSLLLATAPELVDMSLLSPEDRFHLGVEGQDPLKNASAEFGHKIIDKFSELITERVIKNIVSHGGTGDTEEGI